MCETESAYISQCQTLSIFLSFCIVTGVILFSESKEFSMDLRHGGLSHDNFCQWSAFDQDTKPKIVDRISRPEACHSTYEDKILLSFATFMPLYWKESKLFLFNKYSGDKLIIKPIQKTIVLFFCLFSSNHFVFVLFLHHVYLYFVRKYL